MRCVVNLFLLSILLSLASGCLSYEVRKPIKRSAAEAYVMGSSDAAVEGYLIGSYSFYGHHPSKLSEILGAADFRYNRYNLHFKSLFKREKEIVGAVGATGGALLFKIYPADFVLEEGQGAVFVIPLPAGEYTFDRFSFYLNEIMVEKWWRSEEGFDVPFEIKAGEATYIGEVRFNHLWGENILGMTLPGGCYVEAFDEFTRDSNLLRQQYPFLDKMPINRRSIRSDILHYYKLTDPLPELARAEAIAGEIL